VRSPRACCPRCSITPAGPAFGPGARECDWCLRYRSIVGNAAHRRRHVRTPELRLSRADFVRWAADRPLICYACGIPERLLVRLELLTQVGHRLRRLGVDRLDNGGDYTLENIDWCCFPCNKAKSSSFTGPEMADRIGPAIGAVWRARLAAAGIEDEWC
jgi:hypothetical protein